MKAGARQPSAHGVAVEVLLDTLSLLLKRGAAERAELNTVWQEGAEIAVLDDAVNPHFLVKTNFIYKL